MRPFNTFKSKDIDLITYLRFKGFKPVSNPIEDGSGTRWAVFQKTQELEGEIVSFLSGNREAQLLNEFRKTRSFLLDLPTVKDTGDRRENNDSRNNAART